MKHLRNAVATNPKFCRGYLWLARIGIDQKQPEEAVANHKRFKRYCLDDEALAGGIAPEYVREIKYYLGLGYLAQGMREQARVAFRACAGEDGAFAARCHEALSKLQ